MAMLNLETRTSETFTTKGGETVNYSELFNAIRKSVEVYGHSGGKGMAAEALEDLFQDSILKAVRYADTFDSRKAQLGTWASRIVGNVARDAFARSMRERATFTSLEALVSVKDSDQEKACADHSAKLAADGSFASDFEAEHKEAEARIEGAIDSLNENYATILRMTRDGKKPREIADELGCPASVVSTVLCRARKALKHALGTEYLSQHGIE